MSVVEKIKEPIALEMKQFQPFFSKSLKSKAPLLNIITNYLIRKKGKQIRPMFVFLAAKLTGEVSQSTYHAAALIELMHTATLIHDDVVDDSYERRGMFSINALWKNKIAVLVGDYLLSKGLLLAVHHKEFELLEIVSEAVREMSEGELIQIEKSRKLDITEEVYFDIITKKTATLIASCTASGAKSTGSSDEIVQKLKRFGVYAGIAFQIKDDLFDYQPKGIIGKPTGNDIKEKKMTLPLIYVLNKAENSERKKIMRLIKNHHNKPAKVRQIIDYVVAKGGIEYTTEKMNFYRDKALSEISGFPDNEIKQSLSDLMFYITNRKK